MVVSSSWPGLSREKQRARAEQLTLKAGLATRCSFRVADALNLPFEDNSFDFVWYRGGGSERY